MAPPKHAAPTARLRPAEHVLAGRYALRQEIGRGGCAVVYEAHDLRLGRIVALKLVKTGARDSQAPARLAREARAGAALHHPNICALSDAGYREDGRPYLVMERLHGETLTQLLHRIRQMTAEDAIDIALQLLSALAAAHQIGIVHRDVKRGSASMTPFFGSSIAASHFEPSWHSRSR